MREASLAHPVSSGRALKERSDELTIGTLIAEVLLLRKEVIQPQVPLRLPCYDFIPITTHTLGDSVLCRFGHRHRVQTAFMM